MNPPAPARKVYFTERLRDLRTAWRVVIVAGFVCATLLFSPPARADDGLGEFGAVVLAGTACTMVGIAGVVTAFGLSAGVVEGTRPGTGWLVAGFTTGGLATASGIALGATLRDRSGIGIGITLGLVGVANLALAGVGIGLPDESTQKRVAMLPFVAPGSDGRAVYGAAVVVDRW